MWIIEVKITATNVTFIFKHGCEHFDELTLYTTLSDGQNKSVFDNRTDFNDLKPDTNYKMHLLGRNKTITDTYSEGWRYIAFKDLLNYQFITLPHSGDIYSIVRNHKFIEINHESNVVAVHIDGQERTKLTNQETFAVKKCKDSTIEITAKDGSSYNISLKRLTSCECPEIIQEAPISYKRDQTTRPILKLSWDPIFTKHQKENILCAVGNYFVSIYPRKFQNTQNFLETSLCELTTSEDVNVEGVSYEGLTLSNSSISIPFLRPENKIEKFYVTFTSAGSSMDAKLIPILPESFKGCNHSLSYNRTELNQCSIYHNQLDINIEGSYNKRMMLRFETPVSG